MRLLIALEMVRGHRYGCPLGVASPSSSPAQDTALSRREHTFKSCRGRQIIQTTWIVLPGQGRSRGNLASCAGPCGQEPGRHREKGMHYDAVHTMMRNQS